ncbi:sulfite exporter TauE/SafE family protein [Anaerolineales bacterium HSG24]|nr:sulfite exporter TauE/SafE family protein [Anaerolineales bacterium HSG24]
MLTSILLTMVILFIAAGLKATFGFGDALLAMPLLALLWRMQTVSPLVSFLGVTVSFIVLGQDWRKVDVRAAWQLILASTVGIPLGLWILVNAPESIVKRILGIILILFGLYNLLKPSLFMLKNDNWNYLFGFIAGMLGGAYNTSGPPVVIYGTLRRWPPDKFRATLQGYFLFTAFLIFIGHGIQGLWTQQVLKLFLLSLPGVLLAIFLGGKLNQRLDPKQFTRFLYMGLIVLGLFLLP